jgi:serine/threonine-protein phosphatase Stp1
MTLKTRYSVQTHVGHKRKVNEDAVLALPELNIWLVSDGMGGHAAGDFASRLITDMAAGIPQDLAPADRLQALRDTIQDAHRLIQKEAETQGFDVIGATVVGLLLADGHFAALWAGDSRLYRLRDGEIDMLTTDHSVVAVLVESGQMTWDEAEHHPQSNAITRAVGVEMCWIWTRYVVKRHPVTVFCCALTG